MIGKFYREIYLKTVRKNIHHFAWPAQKLSGTVLHVHNLLKMTLKKKALAMVDPLSKQNKFSVKVEKLSWVY